MADDISRVLEHIRALYHPTEPTDRYASDLGRRDCVGRALAMGRSVDELVRCADNAPLLTKERARRWFLDYPSPVRFYRDDESILQLLALNPLRGPRGVELELEPEPEPPPVEVRRAELAETRERLSAFVARFGAPPSFA